MHRFPKPSVPAPGTTTREGFLVRLGVNLVLLELAPHVLTTDLEGEDGES